MWGACRPVTVKINRPVSSLRSAFLAYVVNLVACCHGFEVSWWVATRFFSSTCLGPVNSETRKPIEKPHKPFTFGSRSIQTIGLRVSEFTGPKQVEEKKRVATHHETSKPWQQATKFTT
jgi:hypothetical protein